MKYIIIGGIIAVLVITALIIIIILNNRKKSEYIEIEDSNSYIDFVEEKKIKDSKKRVNSKTSVENNGLIDYSIYKMDKIENIKWLLVGMGVVFIAGYIFYRDIVWAGVFSLVGLFYPKIKVKQIIKNRRQKLLLQFKEALYIISTSLSAGRSIENSFLDAKNDLETIFDFGKENYIVRELISINRRIEMNRTIEDALDDLAERSGLEDIKTFANVFSSCNTTGGNLKSVTEMTSRIIGEKISVKQDIATIISGKKFEATILTFIPFAIVIMIKITAPEFISSLYTFAGRLLSTGALLVIAISTLWAQKIMDIEV